ISGDRPIVLVRIHEVEELPLIQQLLSAHTYWRLKGLEADLVILNEHPAGYFEELHQQVQNLVRASDAHALVDRPGGVFVRKGSQIADEDKILLQTAARVVLAGNQGSLAGQVDRIERAPRLPARLPGTRGTDAVTRRREDGVTRPQAQHDFLFANGQG